MCYQTAHSCTVGCITGFRAAIFLVTNSVCLCGNILFFGAAYRWCSQTLSNRPHANTHTHTLPLGDMLTHEREEKSPEQRNFTPVRVTWWEVGLETGLRPSSLPAVCSERCCPLVVAPVALIRPDVALPGLLAHYVCQQPNVIHPSTHYSIFLSYFSKK